MHPRQLQLPPQRSLIRLTAHLRILSCNNTHEAADAEAVVLAEAVEESVRALDAQGAGLALDAQEIGPVLDAQEIGPVDAQEIGPTVM